MGMIEARMDGIDGRIGRLETCMDRVEARLGSVEQKVAEMNGKLDVLVSHVVSKLPSWWQMPVVIAATVALLGGMLAAVQKLHLLG